MFSKEDRYIVFKLKDLANLTYGELAMLEDLAEKVTKFRHIRGKKPLTCVVVESDWKCYDRVWNLVEEEDADESTIYS